MGEGYSVAHAAACIACPPVGGALWARLNPDYSLLLRDLPLRAVADALSDKDGGDDISSQVEPLPRNEFIEWLNSDFKEGGGGRVIR